MTESEVREIVASLAGKAADEIQANTQLSGVVGGSLGRARLDAVLRSRAGQSFPVVYRAVTFGELAEGICGVQSSAEPPKSLPRLSAGVVVGQAVGVDIESVAALPEAVDYWETDFYREMFTANGIAYALMQSEPRATFAGMWCAKEAARKAVPAIAEVDWKSIEVVHDETGRPSIRWGSGATGGALSISHALEYAVAVFLAGSAPETPASRAGQDTEAA